MHSDLPVAAIKCDQKHKKCRFELLVDEPKYQPFRRFVRNGLAEKLVKTLREGEDIQTEYGVLNYRIDLYFRTYKLAIEADEFGYSDRNIDYKTERRKAIKNSLVINLLQLILMKKF